RGEGTMRRSCVRPGIRCGGGERATEMGDVRYVEGRRTGRRPGSKSTPAWKKAAAWVARTIDKPDAGRPRACAGGRRDEAVRQPLAFLHVLAALEHMPDSGDRQVDVPSGAAPQRQAEPVRALKVSVSLPGLSAYLLTGGEATWAGRL